MSNAPQSLVDSILKTSIVRIPLMLGIAAGMVVAIAGGFYVTYLVVTWMGN